MEGSPSRKRKQLTLNTKYEIIKACETESKTSVAKKFEVAPSTITGILKMKDMIIQSFHSSTSSPSRKRHRSGNADTVDKALFEWFTGARSNKIHLNTKHNKTEYLTHSCLFIYSN